MGCESQSIKRMAAAGLIAVTGLAVAGGDANVTMANQQHIDQNRYLEAAAAAQRGDYVVAYCFWRPLAEKGDAEAQYALGWMYHNGYGLVSDDRAAKGWWEKAVVQGHADAMFSLGSLYSIGSATVARDLGAAMRLWGQAAALGHEHARFALRELAMRNLPDLAAITTSLRMQYPGLQDVLSPRTNLKTRLQRNSRTKRAEAQHTEEVRPFGLQLGSGELIAVAAGYRPEYGWAAVSMLKAAGRILTSTAW